MHKNLFKDFSIFIHDIRYIDAMHLDALKLALYYFEGLISDVRII